MKENQESKKQRVSAILKKLRTVYPGATCALHYETPFQLLAATILSAQCTDERVNMVTPRLFKRFPDAKSMSQAESAEVEGIIQSTGFFRSKTRHILGASKLLVERHGGEVPNDLDLLTQLPGVGRKTANVVRGYAYGVPGITVDTHMIRVNRLLKFTLHKDPVKIEKDLNLIVPEPAWTEYSSLIIHHGRNRCFARRPECGSCEIQKWCPSVSVESPRNPKKP